MRTPSTAISQNSLVHTLPFVLRSDQARRSLIFKALQLFLLLIVDHPSLLALLTVGQSKCPMEVSIPARGYFHIRNSYNVTYNNPIFIIKSLYYKLLL